MSNEGKKVKVHYTGTLDDGTKFDSSVDRGEPIEFTCAAGQMIPGFDAAVKDMEQGETKTVHIPAAEAYGERREEMVQKVPVSQIPNGDQLPVGQTVYMRGPAGQSFPVFVEAIEDGIVTFDMNHELAGKDLNFEITLVEVAGERHPPTWQRPRKAPEGAFRHSARRHAPHPQASSARPSEAQPAPNVRPPRPPCPLRSSTPSKADGDNTTMTSSAPSATTTGRSIPWISRQRVRTLPACDSCRTSMPLTPSPCGAPNRASARRRRSGPGGSARRRAGRGGRAPRR